jgi:hypothetical protein
MEAFVEQSVALVVLAYVAGLGCAGLVVGLTSRRRRARRRAGPAAPRLRPPPDDDLARPPAPLPEPLFAGAPAHEVGDVPRTRREARTRR